MALSLLLFRPAIPFFAAKFSNRSLLFSFPPPKTLRQMPEHRTRLCLFLFRPGDFRGCWWRRPAGTSLGEEEEKEKSEYIIGEDSAAFELDQQKLSSWVTFTVILGVVLAALNVIWIDSSSGFGKYFISAVSGLSESHEIVESEDHGRASKTCVLDEGGRFQSSNFAFQITVAKLSDFCGQLVVTMNDSVVMLLLVFLFAAVHSGMASFRDAGEKLIGERSYRVLFAGISLPLAVSTVVYFINHRYDGVQLWNVQSVPGVHQLVWLSSFLSFFFLYPSTFNLLEVAAVDKPKMHLWETGIMRITRHPQMVGQVVWCVAHTLWIGNSVVLAASMGLIAHHLFGVWNGDRRLAARYGGAFDVVKSRTSVLPFAAIIDSRQKLPKDYYKEFLRLPYLTITAVTLGAYFAHPLMQAECFRLKW